MKKLSVLFVFLLCLLTACGCRHEWTDADCLTAKTCSKCAATEGEALGHDFAPATCTDPKTCSRCALTEADPLGHDFAAATCSAPKTCTRCALTQGESLPHVYGSWTVNEGDMTRTCSNCGDVESSEIDRELYLKQRLQGHWDFLQIVQNGAETSATQIASNVVGYYFSADDNLSGIFFNGNEQFNYTMEFLDYEESDGSGFYYATMTFETGESTLFALNGETDTAFMFLSDEDYIAFSGYEPVASALPGSFAAADSGAVYTVHLNPDHTFSGNPDGEVSGTWHLRPFTSDYGSRSCSISLRYEKDGKPVVCTGLLNLGPDSIPLEQYLEQCLEQPQLNFGINCNGVYLDFHAATEEDIATLTASQQDGLSKLNGTWISKSIYTYDQNTGSGNTAVTEDYSITFGADGTFTALLDKDRSGTWAFREASLAYGQITYYYTLNFHGVGEPIQAMVNPDGEFFFYGTDSNLYKTLYFMPDADKAEWAQLQSEGTSRILGTWNSIRISTSGSTTYTNKNVLDYTITFREDGTFSAGIDREYTGTWKLADVHTYTDSYGTNVSFDYSLSFDDISEIVSAGMSSGNFYIYHYEDAVTKSLYFVQLSEASAATLKNLPASAAGSWKASTGETMKVSADGTFTASFGQSAGGTWHIMNYTEDEGIYFIFTFDGDNSGLLFTSRDGETLEAWIQQDNGEYRELLMTKN